jgi:hypothetical protein
VVESDLEVGRFERAAPTPRLTAGRPAREAARAKALQGEEILQTIAEVSVAFAGFTGVVVAFGRRPQPGVSTVNAHAFKAMLASSLQALLFSVLPFLFAASGLSEPRLWRVASAFMLLGLLAGAAVDVYFARRTDPVEWTRFDRAFQVLIPLFGLAAVIGQLINLFGGVEHPFAPYLGGLLFFLFFSSVMFVRLLTAEEPENRT